MLSTPDPLLVLLATIQYGKGRILLAPSYPVDLNHAFSDMVFFNMLKEAAMNHGMKEGTMR